MIVCNVKSELRRELINKRNNIKNKNEKDKIIFNKLIKLPKFDKSKTVLTYISMPNEIDTISLINYCFDTGKTIAVPKVIDDSIKFYKINSFSGLLKSSFGCLEPKDSHNEILDFEKSVCITPTLACDVKNHRLGYGGGYYDRFLSFFSGYSIGLCYYENIFDIPVEIHDIPLDIIISE